MILFGLGVDLIIKTTRWCEGVSWVLSLQSYMFGDSQEAVEVEARGEDEEEELGEVGGTSFQFNRYIPRLHWCPTSMRKALERLTKLCFRERDPPVSSRSPNPPALVPELLDCWDLW